MVTFGRLLTLLLVALLNPGLALAQSLTELILVIGLDDSVDEPSLRLALQLADARAEPLLTDAPADAPPTLRGAYVVTLPSHKATTLAELLRLDAENVVRVEDNVRVFAPPNIGSGPCEGSGGLTSVNDPLAPAQLELTVNGVDPVLVALAAMAQRASPQTVAVIDTGVNAMHEDLAGLVSPLSSKDPNGHGTAVAGRVAANTDNGLGLASLNYGGAYLRVRSYPALAEKNASGDDIARAIVAATNDGASVINMSFGGRGDAPDIVVAAIHYATAHNVLLVAAAGNDGLFGDGSTRWPANVPGVLAVSVGDRRGAVPEYASRLTDLPSGAWASGDGVCVLDNDAGYRRDSGSSFSAASVSGMLGVARALCPGLTMEETELLIERSGVPMQDEDGVLIIVDTFFMALDANAQKVCTSP